MARLIKPIPPYANNLGKRVQTIWLYFGSTEAWERAKRAVLLGWRNVLILPPDKQPADFDWCLVEGCSVVVIELAETSPPLRKAMVHALAVHGAKDAYLVPFSKRAEDAVLWNCGQMQEEAA